MPGPEFNMNFIDSFTNKAYQTKLNETTQKLFAGKDKISKNELMNASNIFEAFKNLSKTGKENLKKLLLWMVMLILFQKKSIKSC